MKQLRRLWPIVADTQVRDSGNGYVSVHPGSVIQANGTAVSPIYFLSDAAGVTGSGE